MHATSYAKSGELSIAYQVLGDGSLDLVVVPGVVSHVEAFHELPGYSRFIEGRLDLRVDHVRQTRNRSLRSCRGCAHLRATDGRHPGSDGCRWKRARCALRNLRRRVAEPLFAASHPDRTRALVTFGAFARVLRAPDYSIGIDLETAARLFSGMLESHGTGASLSVYSPSCGEDREAQALWAKVERLSASPGGFGSLAQQLAEVDVRCVLPAVKVPTLGLRAEHDFFPIEISKHLAQEIPGARWLELKGVDDYPWFGSVDSLPSSPPPNQALQLTWHSAFRLRSGSLLATGRASAASDAAPGGVMEEVEIAPLRLAVVELPSFHPEAPGSCEIFGFLIRDGTDRILVDTGIGEGSSLIERLYKPRRTDLGAALANAGTSLEQVKAIVNSHLHFDHCGNNGLFPGVPIFVQETELEAAHQPNYTVHEWVDFPESNYALTRGEQRISPHVALLPSPGHTPGHQSVVVHSRGGAELIVAQAAYTASEFEASRVGESNVPQGSWSPRSYAASLRALHAIGARRAFFSHDSAVWSGAP